MKRTSTAAIALAVLCHIVIVSAADSVPVAQVVFGSFGTEQGAQAAVQIYRNKTNLPLQISTAEVNGIIFYRVLSKPTANVLQVDAEAKRIRQKVVAGAWVLRSSQQSSSGLAATDSITNNRVTSGPQASSSVANHPIADKTKPRSLDDQVSQEMTFDPVSGGQLVDKNRGGAPYIPKKDEGTSPGDRSVKLKLGNNASSIAIKRISDAEINIDGKMDESIWAQLPTIDQFVVIEPDTLSKPRYHSEVKVFYTEEGLYIGTLNEQPSDTLLARLTSRDTYINRDGVSLTLDTSGTGLYGLWFGINLGGSLVDGTVLPERNYSSDWNGPWKGNSYITEDGYTTEMFLPWSMMSMPESDKERVMGIYFSRKVAYLDERWSFPALPPTGSRLMSALQPIEMADVQPRPQIAVFPFTSVSYDNLAKNGDEQGYEIGADIFWRPSTDLQLTATINPDFGAVESDNVDVNLTATETFFPDKRLFFLEGSEIFNTTPRSNPRSQGIGNSSVGARRARTSFNPTPTTLVNTRRIGGAPIEPMVPAGIDLPATELSKPSDLLGALKLTGQNGAFRYGVLAAAENDTEFETDTNGNPVLIEQTGRDFGIVRVLYNAPGPGRRSIGWMSTAVTHENQDAFVHGVDLHYQNPGRQWNLDAQLIASDVTSDVMPGANTKGYGMFFDATYIPRRGRSYSLALDLLDDKLDIDAFGFIRRNDAMGVNFSRNTLTSDITWARTFSNSFNFSQEYNGDGHVVRSGLFWRTSTNFNNSMAFNSRLSYFPHRWDDQNSQGNGDFRIHDRWSGAMSFGTDSSKILSVSIGTGAQQEDRGDWTYQGQLGVTFKPSDRISFEVDAIYKNRDGWLLYQGGRDFTTFSAEEWQPQVAMDVFLSARHQLRLTMQWAGINASEQDFFSVPVGDGSLLPRIKDPSETTDSFTISKVVAQLRYRWEIAPLSDLFLVYTRGGNLPNRVDDEFGDLFHDTLTEPVIDVFFVKLRYRFGN